MYLVRKLAAERRVAVETIEAFAESIPLATATFDLVVCRLAAHHFSDLPKAMAEMTRLARPGGHVAVIDTEGDENPALAALMLMPGPAPWLARESIFEFTFTEPKNRNPA